MTKVILTKEQRDSINRSLESNGGDSSKVLLLFIGGLLHGANSCLKKLTLEQMTKALLIGYEIEQPKIEVGDWVKIKKLFNPIFNDGMNEAAYKLERIFKVTEIVLEGKILCPDRYVHYPENLCHATKEEAFWAELGREVGEFKDDDIGIDNSDIIRDGKAELEHYYKLNRLKGFYPSESFKLFPTGNE